MKKALILFSISALGVAVLPTITYAAVPKAGSACTKSGSTVIAGGLKFTCTKSGSKLVWSKGVAASNTALSSKPSATPQSSAAPVAQSSGDSFPNSMGHKEGDTCTNEFDFTDLSIGFECWNRDGKLQWHQFALRGSGCLTEGATSTVGLVNFICQKSANGNQLRLKITSIKSNNFSKIPITLPVKPDSSGITFDTLLANKDSIANAAWTKLMDVFNNNTPVAIQNNIFTGPGTTALTKDIQGSFAKAQRLWSGFYQPSMTNNVFFNLADDPWAQNQIMQFPLGKIQQNLTDLVQQSCNPNFCGGAHDGAGPHTKESVGVFSIDPKMASDKYVTDGGIVFHEYTHAVQTAQFFGSDTPDALNDMQYITPCWFIEGQANYVGNAPLYPSASAWNGQRGAFMDSHQIPSFTDFSPSSLYDYLTKQIPGNEPGECQPTEQYQLGYSVGAFAVEAMTAVGGIQSTMAVLAKEADGLSWADAFQAVYGVKWESAAQSMANLISSEMATFVSQGLIHKR